jgi:imidazolonepropionase-like amidohydrolase
MRHFLRFLPVLVCALWLQAVSAQQTFPKAATSEPHEGLFAFTHATIYTDYKTKLENATLLIRKGKIEACAVQVNVPKDAVVVDCTGKTIYPAFIDLYAAGFGLPAPQAEGKSPDQRPQMYSNKKGAFAWNEALKPEFNAAGAYAMDTKTADEWRKLGFGTLLTHRPDGIARGVGALVALTDEREHDGIVLEKASNHLSFRKGTSTQDYPSSLMGCIALIRQTYLDAQWYKADGAQQEQNLSLGAWNAAQTLPQIFEASDKQDILRIARIGREFSVQYLVKTAGDEYQRLDDVKNTGQTLIVPLTFPDGFDVRNPYDAQNVSLRELKHWELAPSNPGRLEKAGIPFALTAYGMKEKSKFWESLRKAVEYGLTEETALKALTQTPAQLLHADGPAGVGSLEAGKLASFFITTGSVFKPDTKFQQIWVKGKSFDITPDKYAGVNLSGQYQLTVGRDLYGLTVKGKPDAPDVTLTKSDSTKVKANLTYANSLITCSFQPDTINKGVVILTGTIQNQDWSGRGTLQDGTWTDWRAVRKNDVPADQPKKQSQASAPELGDVIYPFTAFGLKEKPVPATYLIQNTTVWTNEKDGILKNTDVLISNGKIVKIGRNLPVQDNAQVIDGSNKHLTAGIIDEHSHIAASRSINEGTQESSAEVRIGDVLDCEDIDIYRQLAGGVTASHILHGSSNPIGGQTQLIKLRWGYGPEEMKFQNWPGFIKFALGENVKQSHWGDNFRSRFPQTRMGVEQVYMDYFTRAREYGQLKKSGKPYRKDLELEALFEILESKRFITCHSYVQSEITMLIRVAEKFGFKVNTFTHILEGYKVAAKMARHGAGGSTFSDWWAYKFEVYDAIPQNAKIMTDHGVTVAINSDDAEMARRLNQEAAKSVMYAGMKEEEAWKMVTINPAKLLHVDDRVGSIRTGKDADVVLWNNNPLSVYARAEKTFIDGIKFYDRDEDVQRRDWVRKERNRIIQKMLSTKKPGESTDKPAPPKKMYHCDSQEDEG